MKRRNMKRLQKAKGSLEKMMETLRPYLPQKQVSVPETAQKWKLPEDYFMPSGRKKRRNPAAL